MKFLNDITRKANELKEKTQNRIKENGGFEGILQKTSEKVDKLAEEAGKTIKKATSETKQYIQEAKNSAQENGDNGFIGVAKTLGGKVTEDVSGLVRSGYQNIANSETVQNLKKEMNEEEEKISKTVEKKHDFSNISFEKIFTYFFSGVQNGNEWTTSSQPNNPKNERLMKITYIINGQEWFNTQSNESGSGPFDLTMDFLSNQTNLNLNDADNKSELNKKTTEMFLKLIEQLKAENVESPSKKETVKETTSVKSKTPVKTVSKTTESVQPKASVKRAPAKKVATKTLSVKKDEQPEQSAASASVTAPKKAPVKKSSVKTASKTTEASQPKSPVKKAPAKKVVKPKNKE